MFSKILLFIVFIVIISSSKILIATSPQTVVLVEDNCVCAKVARGKLGALGFQVKEALNGEEGLALARQLAKSNQDFLIITDMNMPVMDGFTLVKELRADENLRDVPIICMSDKNYEAPAREAGANAFVQKPFTNDSFKTCIENLLTKKSKTPE